MQFALQSAGDWRIRHAEVERNAANLRVTIPPALWADLKAEGLLRRDAPWWFKQHEPGDPAPSELDIETQDWGSLWHAIEALWRSTYACDPSLQERAWARGAIGPDVDDPAAWEDLLFAMLQSTEFTSNH